MRVIERKAATKVCSALPMTLKCMESLVSEVEIGMKATLQDASPTTSRGSPASLQGIRVVDFTRWLAGPYSTQTLSDLGAEVIKIEDPATGDDTRTFTGGDLNGESGFYLALNRNKKGIVLNLATGAGQKVARDLVARADIVVENFSPGIMAKFGLDYASLLKIRPHLIYCSVSGYGSTAKRPGYDVIAQAESGFLSLTGESDRNPVRTGVQVIDFATAMNATQAILAALFHRERTGKGQFVEVALLDTAVAMLSGFAVNYLISGKEPQRTGNTSALASPVGLYRTADGLIYLSCANDRLWRKFATEVLDRPDLANDPEFATNRARVRNQAMLETMIEAVFSKQTGEMLMRKLIASTVPAGIVRSVGEALTSPELVERNLVRYVPHPAGGMVPIVRSPLQLSLTPTIEPVAAPMLGQHTEEVLKGVLEYSDEQIAQLRAAGCFGAGKSL